MKTLAHKHDSHLIVYDADVIEHPGSFLFSPDYWSEQGAVTGTATGRGSALFLDSPFGPAVLRQYLRGGWAAKASRDRYVFSGFEQSRPVAEFAVLEQLSTAGLPAPAPLAAMCAREGPFYRGWILMRMISGVMPLAIARGKSPIASFMTRIFCVDADSPVPGPLVVTTSMNCLATRAALVISSTGR